jgi:CRISPR-associated protein Cmr2
MYLLAGRKSIRNFSQLPPFPKTPKCSLCGARESVFVRGFPMKRDVALRLRLKSSEDLCAVGLTKRLGGGKLPFPSVVRVACDPWLRGIRQDTRTIDGKTGADILNEIAKLCAGDTTFASGTGRRKRDGKYEKMYPDFPFDGQILFTDRLKGLIKDLHEFIGKEPEIPEDEKREIKRHVQELLAKEIDEISSMSSDLYEDLVRLEEIEKRVRMLQQENNKKGFGFGNPDPYLAVLSADGDGMGAVISSRETADEHRDFSSTLAGFAGEARKIVEQQFSGCMVYSGGDDVFAFLPVDRCIAAARKLHDEFGKTMKRIEGGNMQGSSPTLSVGIAIGHSLDPLEDLLTYAREAERAAKDPDRNGLAVHLHVRGGGEPIRIREQWKDAPDPKGIDKRMERWVEMHVKELLPDRAAYDLLELAGDYKGWKGAPSDLITSDIRRLLHRKRAGLGSRKITENDIAFLTDGIASYDDIVRRADELILARRIAHIEKLAEGSSTGGVAP